MNVENIKISKIIKKKSISYFQVIRYLGNDYIGNIAFEFNYRKIQIAFQNGGINNAKSIGYYALNDMGYHDYKNKIIYLEKLKNDFNFETLEKMDRRWMNVADIMNWPVLLISKSPKLAAILIQRAFRHRIYRPLIKKKNAAAVIIQKNWMIYYYSLKGTGYQKRKNHFESIRKNVHLMKN